MAQFPAELTDRIIDLLHSDKRALAACSLVCRSWIPASRNHFFRDLTVITTGNACPLFNLFESNISKDVTGFSLQPLSSVLSVSKVPKGTEFFNYVQTVSWTVDGEPKWLTEPVMRIIASFPLLSGLNITRSGPSYLPFEIFKNIKILIFHGYLSDVVPRLAKAIANSPELESLDISRGKFYDSDYAPQLHEFFASIPPDSPPLKLRHLGVGDFRLGLDATIIPHIRSLRSLEWVDPCDTVPGDYRTSSVEVWETLKSEGLQLSRLKTSLIGYELFEFLSSSRGMRELRLERSSRPRHSHASLARVFFRSVLPRLADSLKVLRIESHYAGDWCVGENNLASILTCMSLEELTVSLYLPGPSKHVSRATVDHLVNNVSLLPHLRFLEILPAVEPSRHRAMFGKTMRNDAYATLLKVTDRFETLVGDVGSIGLELRVGERRMFVPRMYSL